MKETVPSVGSSSLQCSMGEGKVCGVGQREHRAGRSKGPRSTVDDEKLVKRNKVPILKVTLLNSPGTITTSN